MCERGHYQEQPFYAQPCAVCTGGLYNLLPDMTSCDRECADTMETTPDGTGCGKCQVHSTAQNGVCSCDERYVDPEGDRYCELAECPAGSFFVPSDNGPASCNECAAATYSPEQDDSTECDGCVGNTYQNEAGAVSCKGPPPNAEVTPARDNFACVYGYVRQIDRCLPCAPGTEGVDSAGENVCQACAPGRYGGGGTAACEKCAEGAYSVRSGAVACTDCPDGQSTAATGSASVDACTCGGHGRTPS